MDTDQNHESKLPGYYGAPYSCNLF